MSDLKNIAIPRNGNGNITTNTKTQTQPLSIKMITYNIWMMPDIITIFARSVSPNKIDRAYRIVQALPKDCDIILFQEAFCKRTRKVLFHEMNKHGYIHQSPVVGHGGCRPVNGGVVLVSRYPIIDAEIKTFGNVCAGDDSLANKGVLYVQIEKDNWNVHIFGTHTQAWEYSKAKQARMKQLEIIADFIEEKRLSMNEPVIVAGDMNIDKYDVEQHQQMLRVLKCEEATYMALDQTKYSADAKRNKLASSGPSSSGSCELLDYILYSKVNLQPESAKTWIIPLKDDSGWNRSRSGTNERIHDLSDHYPVMVEMTFSRGRIDK
jgi:endonuclease/exonuclease/phosphatase family metal-dependent hydrolase